MLIESLQKFRYGSSAQDIWIDVSHSDGQWGLHNEYSNWANEDKAKDPGQYGDVAAMKAGTKRKVFRKELEVLVIRY